MSLSEKEVYGFVDTFGDTFDILNLVMNILDEGVDNVTFYNSFAWAVKVNEEPDILSYVLDYISHETLECNVSCSKNVIPYAEHFCLAKSCIYQW